MSALLSFDVDERRALAASALSPLASALRAELEPLVHGPLPIPEQKARLTRVGGRCSFDATLLDFDPWSPHEHQCPQCHRVFIDRAHDDWWAMGAQLWVAERAAQAAALHTVTGEDAMGTLALRVLGELADRYEGWPNKDNALGPTRPFFSTYLESIWLINLCQAVALLEQQTGADLGVLERVRRKLVLPSRDLIASFHEGRSNRQVWNEVAILSASRILGDDRTFDDRLQTSRGLFDLFAHGLLDDGTWYEGENYHLFAHRGLWYGVQLLRAAGVPLPENLEHRFRTGFVTPFLGVLPDDTLPSRRDSQYKVSIRQWRFAEWCEMGIAHAWASDTQPDERLVGTVHRLYHPDDAQQMRAKHRHPFSTADAERNEPAGLLSRADLSWRALLMSVPVLPDAASWAPGSICLPAQGLAVIRRDAGQTYVALEGGHTGGGHGHPDRLALTVQRGHDRWLEDPGTGSYVEQKLHWYRSTLAHAAPLVNGASQDAVPAKLLAFEDRGGAGWMCKRVENVKPGVNIQRTIVVCDGYFVDLLEWDADRVVQIDLSLPRGFHVEGLSVMQPADPQGAGGLEDGFDFLTDVVVDAHPQRDCSMGDTVLRTLEAGSFDRLHYTANATVQTWRADAPGPPGQGRGPLHWFRMVAAKGCLIGIGAWVDLEKMRATVDREGLQSLSVTVGETESTHTRTELGWHIALKARHATSSIDLSYLSQPTPIKDSAGGNPGTHAETSIATSLNALPSVTTKPVAIVLTTIPGQLVFSLGEAHYRQTEQTWTEAGKPSATVTMGVSDDALEIVVTAITGEIVVPRAGDENVLDNERQDVNADGVELFIGPGTSEPWSASWLVVPASDCAPLAEPDCPRITPTTVGSPALSASWSSMRTDHMLKAHAGMTDGYVMKLRLLLHSIPTHADGTFALELIVNERPTDRARRRGQLVLSAGAGFAYLRGDRADSANALTIRLPAATEKPAY
ncbi:MAG: heparinase II/III family protein [Gemmatimonadaceae bacterium]